MGGITCRDREIHLVRRLELWALFTIIALGAWIGNTREQRLALTWSISQNQDGSGGYVVRVEGNRLSGPTGSRALTDRDVEQIHRALDDSGACGFKFFKGGPSPSLYTHAWIKRGHQSPIELRWDGIASTSQMRLVDALFRSPLGPELRQCVQMARSPLEEQETRRRNSVSTRGRFLRCRQEMLLEVAQAQRVLPLLEYAYPQVKLEAHPTMNGFYPSGRRENILQIKNDIPNLERLPFLQEPTASTSPNCVGRWANADVLGEWMPKNSDGRFRGSAALRKELLGSRSVQSSWAGAGALQAELHSALTTSRLSLVR